MKALEYLDNLGVEYKKVELEEAPRTAEDIERLYGCSLSKVLKTILVMGNKPILIVLQGNLKISFEKLREYFHIEDIRMATPDEVMSITGYTIGSVTPFGIDDKDIDIIVDRNVFGEDRVNIGSGVPEIGIELSTRDLDYIWHGDIFDVTEVD